MQVASIDQLNKFYGKHHVLKDVSFDLQQGRIVGLIGPNGSGKTTLMKVICGMVKPTCGSVIVNTKFSSLIETPCFYSQMSGFDNLMYFAALKGSSKCDVAKIIDLLGLNDYINKKCSRYSLGMRQKLGIAVCLIGNPKFIMLDEPINGLDPSAIIEMRTIFKRLKDEFGITILISSHILKEMQDICDSIIFIKDGTLIGNLPIERQTNKYIITLFDERDKLKVCEQFDIDNNQVVAGNEVCVRGDMPVYNIVQRLVTNGVKIIGVCKAQTSIENLYRKYYGDKEND